MTQNIVIIGASSGALVAKALTSSLPESHRLILIEKLEYAYHPVSSLRGAVVEGKEEDSFADLDSFFPSGSRHVVLKGTEVKQLHANSLTLSKEFEGSTQLDFAYAVLGLGATYNPPSRPASVSKQEAIAGQRALQAAVKQSKSLLIIGGGPVGVEFSGEVRTVYSDKKITLVTSGPLLPGAWKDSLRNKLTSLLHSNKIEVKTQTSIEIPEDVPIAEHLPTPRDITLSDGSKVSTDFVLIATGGKPNTTLLTSSGFGANLDENNRIKVNPTTLKVADGELAERYFAFGDASNAPGPKTYFAATQQVPVLTSQILAAINKGKAKTWKEPMNVMVVPFGPSNGHGQIGPFVLGGWFTSFAKGKTLFVPDFKKLYQA
ncbi:unnamed protein product [Sympodiomycopsis kandeliae]